MRHFTSITQLGDLSKTLEAAKYVKENPFADQSLGRNKTLHPEGCNEPRNERHRT